MTDPDQFPVKDLFELCDVDPYRALEIIEGMTQPVVDVVELARFRAYQMAAMQPLMEAGVPWHAERDELIMASRGDTLSLCERAVQLIARLEGSPADLYYISPETFSAPVLNGEDNQDKSRADAICRMLETFRPTRVQEMRGRTKLSYFSPARVGASPEVRLREKLTDGTTEKLLDAFLEADQAIGSVRTIDVLAKRDGSMLLKCEVFREVTRTSPVEAPGAPIGMMLIGEDGSHFFEPA